MRLVIPGLDPIEAVVDYRTSHFIGLRSDDALCRFYGRNAFGGQVDAVHHLFAEGVDANTTRKAWQTWPWRRLRLRRPGLRISEVG